jgi:PKD repeat protein
LNLSFDECSNIRVKECINVVNVKYVLFTYISDSCPCQGFIPFTVMFTIIIDPEDFKLVKYALFDFGDGTYSIDVALMYLHIYKFVGIYTPTLYLSTTPILFSIDQYNIVVESDCISKYTRLDYVVAIYPGFIITPDTQTSTKYYTATFTVNKYSIPIDQRHPNKCIAEPLKGDIWASYEWNAFFDFGDGEFSTEFIDIYTHLYKYVGTYKATLYLSINFIDYDVVGTVINIINISETWFYSVYVIIIDIPFSIIITPNIGITPINANLKLIVDDTLFNTYIHYVLWDFNDLTISKKLDISEDHAFLAISDTITYSVTVYISAIQIKYSLGSKLTILSSDTVYSASANVTVIYPHIDFIAAPLSGYVPLSVEFTIIINIPSELQYIAAFGFNFGDNESSDINLNLIHTHIYQISGMFDVELFITDTVGSIIKYKGIITSAPNPILYPGFCIEFIIISKLLYIEAIDNPTFILTITISIAKTYTLELYVVPNNSGTISINSGAYTCSNGILNPCINSFLENSFFTFDSIPALGFDFAAWYGLSSPLISNLFLTTNSVVWAQFTPSVTCNLVIKITIAVILTISFNSTYTLTINIDII